MARQNRIRLSVTAVPIIIVSVFAALVCLLTARYLNTFITIVTVWAFACAATTCLGYLASRAFTRMAYAAEHIGRGERFRKLPVFGRGAAARLARGMNNLRRFTSSFIRYTNKTAFDLPETVTIKNTAVLVCDVHSFETAAPLMDNIIGSIYGVGGVVDSFSCGEITAHWFADDYAGSEASAVLRAVYAALSIRGAVCCYNIKRDNKKPEIKTVCAITSGMAGAGLFGSDDYAAWIVSGPPVPLAGAIKSRCAEFRCDIIISEETRKLIAEKIITGGLPAVKYHGKQAGRYALININDGECKDEIFKNIARLKHIDLKICRAFIGPGGPQALAALRLGEARFRGTPV